MINRGKLKEFLQEKEIYYKTQTKYSTNNTEEQQTNKQIYEAIILLTKTLEQCQNQPDDYLIEQINKHMKNYSQQYNNMLTKPLNKRIGTARAYSTIKTIRNKIRRGDFTWYSTYYHPYKKLTKHKITLTKQTKK